MESDERIYNPVYKCRLCGDKRAAHGVRVKQYGIEPDGQMHDAIGNYVPQTCVCFCGDDMGIGICDLIGFTPEQPEPPKVETNVFDEEEIHENCTVQILRNSVTGEISVGWWENKDEH